MIKYHMLEYDVVIIGSGPAGTNAAIYVGMSGYNKDKIAVLTGEMPGGLLTTTTIVDNYLGLPGIDGNDLCKKFIDHAKKYATFITTYVTKILYVDKKYILETSAGTIQARGIIICTGSSPRKLGLESEYRLQHGGVSYCAICDGFLYKDKPVAVIGGGNSAFEEVCYLSTIATKVYLIHRSDKFRAFPEMQEKVQKLILAGKVELILNAQIQEFLSTESMGSEYLTAIQLADGRIINVDGAFIAIGQSSNNNFIDWVQKDPLGYIITNSQCKTNMPHLYAAGDAAVMYDSAQAEITKFKQAIIAAAHGATAALNLCAELNEE